MPNVVVDTHVFIRSLAPEAEYREVTDTIIKVCHTLVINEPIVDEYMDQAQRAGISPELVQRVLQGQELLAVGKIRKTASRSSGRPVSGIPDQDQPFVEAYRASGAQYLISNDPNFHSQLRRLRRHRIQVVYPHEYLQEHKPT